MKLKKRFDEKYENAANAFLEKCVRSLKEDNPGKAYANLKKLGSQPGDCVDGGAFTLLSHLDQTLSISESTEKIAEHFASINQEYPPFDQQLLPPNVQTIISAPVNPDDVPELPDHDVYQKIKRTKKPKSSVPGDLPRRLVQEFGPELAAPVSMIYRNITKSGKLPNPITED